MAEEPKGCPVLVRTIDGRAFLELRHHDGGTALVRRDSIVQVVVNHFGKVAVWCQQNVYPTIHEYDEVLRAMTDDGPTLADSQPLDPIDVDAARSARGETR